MPINMSESRANQVIDALEAEWKPIVAQQLDEAMRQACESDAFGGF